MKVKVKNRKRYANFVFKGDPVRVALHVAASGNLFFQGDLGGEPVAGFVWKHGGGHYFESDALGKRDEWEFYQLLVDTAKFKVNKK